MTILTLTLNGQVTLKKELQQHLDVKPGDQVEVVALPNGKLEVSAVKSKSGGEGGLEAFFGSLKNDHDVRLTLDEIRDAISAGWAAEMRLTNDR